jgi:hypothetical protein
MTSLEVAETSGLLRFLRSGKLTAQPSRYPISQRWLSGPAGGRPCYGKLSSSDSPSAEASSETTDLGQKSVNGVMATGTRLVRTIPSGAIGNDKPITSTIEKWVSADLGIPVQITQKSSIGGDLSLNLGHLVRGEPDPTLFTVPAGYKVQNITMPTPTSASATGAVVSSGTATVTAVK